MALFSSQDKKLRLLGNLLSPDRPIRNKEHLRGREKELEKIVDELKYYHSVPFIFGERGVGKTSLARTAAQIATPSDRKPIYLACAPGARMLDIFREVAHLLLQMAIRLNDVQTLKTKLDMNLSLNPGIRLTLENQKPSIEPFSDANEAVRTLKDIDSILSKANQTIVIIDELEELNDDDRVHLAFLMKQLGDQDFDMRYVLVGIAENVHELIGAHASVPRYKYEVSLSPLTGQDLIDIIQEAAQKIAVKISHDILCRIALIGNGYPHFAHLIGKSLLHEAVKNNCNDITDSIYKQGIARAVDGSIEELKVSYETATHRQDDVYKYLIWTLADSDVVDIRIDDWIERCIKLGKKHRWELPDNEILSNRIQRLSQKTYGEIVMNTPLRYGSSDSRYRYKRFRNSLMRGHVRLMADSNDIVLGNMTTV